MVILVNVPKNPKKPCASIGVKLVRQLMIAIAIRIQKSEFGFKQERERDGYIMLHLHIVISSRV